MEQTLPVLCRSKRAVASMLEAVDKENATDAARMMESGKLTGPLGNQIHDFFIDEIINEAHEVWKASVPGYEDAFPVYVIEYEGVYFVWVPEFDEAGYFLRLEDAKRCVFASYEGAEEGSE